MIGAHRPTLLLASGSLYIRLCIRQPSLQSSKGDKRTHLLSKTFRCARLSPPSQAPQDIMQTSEIPRPPLSSASYSADAFLKETPQVYGTPQQFLASDMRSPYNSNEKGSEDQSPRPSRFNPHRKYSKEWWATAWDTSVEVGRWPRIFYFSFGAILIIIWTIAMLIFANNVVKDEKANSAGTLPKHGSTRLPGEVRDV
jgi:hypothetical protein